MKGENRMARLKELEKSRSTILEEMGALGEMRRGSLAERFRPCGKPKCRCKRPGDRGHGPTYSLTYKVEGKTKMETIPQHRVARVREQLENRQRFGELSKRFLEINEEICRLRFQESVTEERGPKKNSVGRSKRKSRKRSTES